MKKTILLSAMAFCGMAVMANAGVEVNPLANSKGQDYKVNASVSRQLVDTHDANATVLSERVLAPGVSEQECVLKNGVKYKRIVKADAQPVKVLKAHCSMKVLKDGTAQPKTGFLPLGAKSILKARLEVTMVARSHGL